MKKFRCVVTLAVTGYNDIATVVGGGKNSFLFIVFQIYPFIHHFES
jgi:hypothetical protein